MGLLSKIKALFKKDEQAESIEEKELSVDEIASSLEEKKKEISESKNGIKIAIIERSKKFEEDTTEAIKVLQEKDLSERKEYERVKLIVNENMNLYISYLKRLISSIKSAEEYNVEEYIKKIFKSLEEFRTNAYKSFEKATFLIGQEMENTKAIIKEYSKDMNGIFVINKSLFEQDENTRKLDILINDLKQNETYDSETGNKIKDVDTEIAQINQNKDSLNKELEGIKNSDAYRDSVAKREMYKKEFDEAGREIERTKNEIDLKMLLRHFYKDEKRNQLLKKYSSNFKSALKEDSELEIIELVKLKQDLDISQLRNAREKFIELSSPLITETDEKISLIEKEIKHLESKIMSLEPNKEIELKKRERILDKKNKLIAEIGKALEVVFPGVKIEH